MIKYKLLDGKNLFGLHKIISDENELTNNKELLAFVVKSTKL